MQISTDAILTSVADTCTFSMLNNKWSLKELVNEEFFTCPVSGDMITKWKASNA